MLSCDVSYEQNKTGIWDQSVPHLATPIVMRVSRVIILKNLASLQRPSPLPGWIAHKTVSSEHKTELRKALCWQEHSPGEAFPQSMDLNFSACVGTP